MRLSTAGFHQSSINAILEHQYKLAKTQQQITTGKKFSSAAEDPIGAVRSAALDRTLAENEQFARNSNIIESRLKYEEQSLADATSLLQAARDLALAGANSTLGQAERRMLANDVRQQLSALLEVANRDDSNGEFLFAGTRTATRPFALGATGVEYNGDLNSRQIRISGTQALADGHTGADVFMNIAERNGVFRATNGGANTGTGSIDVGRVVDPTAWVDDNYTIEFTTATDWRVIDDETPLPNEIATGTGFTPGQSISFNGITVTITGAPAANDTFAVQPAQNVDMFAILEELAVTLETSGPSGTAAADFSNRIGAAIASIDQALERTIGVRSEVGARLSAIEQAAGVRESEAVDLQALLSELRDVDYAQAISQLNQQYAGLQAAQAAYTRIAQMSLFDFLR